MKKIIFIIFAILQFVTPDPFVRGAGIINGDKYTITLSLPKQEYKMYEPVIAKLTLVNHDTKPINIYNLYDDLSGEPHFSIRDPLGHVYDSRNIVGFFLSFYSSEIQPGDSLIFSMTMNNWGKETSYNRTLSLDEVYFDQFGYFPVGDYRAHFYCSPERDEREVVSNEVSFKVSGLSQEDKEILRLYKLKNYDEIIIRYSGNVFAEHVVMWKMLPYWNTVTASTEADYNNFIQTYPKSMYLYSWRFMLPYVKAAENREDSFEKGVDYLVNLQGDESLAKKSLTNESFITIIKNYGKALEKNK